MLAIDLEFESPFNTTYLRVVVGTLALEVAFLVVVTVVGAGVVELLVADGSVVLLLVAAGVVVFVSVLLFVVLVSDPGTFTAAAQLNEKSAVSYIVWMIGMLYNVKLTGMMLLGFVRLNVKVPLLPEVITGPTL